MCDMDEVFLMRKKIKRQDSEGWSRTNSSTGDGHDVSPSPDGMGMESEMDKKLRHKLVERNRRERTRELLAELQNSCPPLQCFAPGTNINLVLQGVLEYLQSDDVTQHQKKRPESSSEPNNTVAKRIERGKVVQIPRGFVGGMYTGAFDAAPMGIIMCTLNGNVVRCNNIFFNLFGLDCHNKPTMFSLTHQDSLPDTLQAAASILLGNKKGIKLHKKCISRDNVVDDFQVEMTCIRKQNKPMFFLCFVRHYNTDNGQARPANSRAIQDRPDGPFAGNREKFIRDQRFFCVDENISNCDPEMAKLVEEAETLPLPAVYVY